MIGMIGMDTVNSPPRTATPNIGSIQKQYPRVLQPTRLVINKVTDGCNIHCRYCSARALSRSTAKMTIECFRAAVDFVLGGTVLGHVLWLFHGGEPLLMGWRWLREAMKQGRNACASQGVSIRYGIVTNGTLIDTNLASLLADERVSVSVSLDGPPEIHNTYRSDGTGTLRGLRFLKKHDVPHRVLGVIHQYNWNRIPEVADFMISEGHMFPKFNVLHHAGRALSLPPLHPEQIVTARQAFLALMVSSEGRFAEVNTAAFVLRFNGMQRTLASAGCSTIVCGAGKGYLGIGPDGSIFPCGRANDLDRDRWRMGNVSRDFSPELACGVLRQFHTEGSRADCYLCDVAEFCDYLCPANRVASELNAPIHCSTTRLFASKLRDLSGVELNKLKDIACRIMNDIPRDCGVPWSDPVTFEGSLQADTPRV